MTHANARSPAYAWRHVVGFGETNLLGNVYFSHPVAWQGRCREMFLRDHAPEVLVELAKDLRLVTLDVSCAYRDELFAFDEVEIRMRLASVAEHRIGLEFEYLVTREGRDVVAAEGRQEVGCMRSGPNGLTPTQVPACLLRALEPFGAITP